MSVNDKSSRDGTRQIVGISLPPDVATAFKAEAARRNLSVRSLFLEMWGQYETRTKDNQAKK